MASGSRDRARSLTLVPSAHADAESSDAGDAGGNKATAREVVLDPDDEIFCAPEANLGEADWNKRVVGDAIERLPSGQREAVRLLKLQEMSLQQAAAVSGTSVVALKVAMHRALKNLRKILTQSSDEK